MARPEQFADSELLAINLVFSPAPRQVRQWTLALPFGSSIADAIDAGSVCSEFPQLLTSRLRVGIWGRKAALTQLLAHNDRVEIYRSLRVDPKVARRERFDRQGAKTAGLFSVRRPGSKAGY